MKTAGDLSHQGAGEVLPPGMGEWHGMTRGAGARVTMFDGMPPVPARQVPRAESVPSPGAVAGYVLEGVMIHDLTGRIIEVNGALCGLLDYMHDELLGVSCGTITSPDYAYAVFSNIKTMAIEGSFVFRSFLAGKSGERLPAEFRSEIGKRDGSLIITSVARVNRRVRGIGGVPREDTDGLRELNEMKNLLFMIVSHDLLSPLSDILASLMILEEGEGDISENRRRLMANMKCQAERTIDMLKNLSLWAALQRKGMPLQRRTVPVKGVIEKACDYFLDAARKKNVSLRIEIDDGVSAYADETMLAAVMRNVISNSVKFCNDSGCVITRAWYSGIWVVIEVDDDGVGMDAGKMKGLFMLAPQKSSQGTRGERGSGLGLFISREVLARNNGMMHITSEQGKGTRCTIRLPRA